MGLIQISFLIFIFLKQFYILSSGGLQPSDLFFILSFTIYIIKCIRDNSFKINTIDKYIILFICLLTIINMSYFMIYKKFDFLISSFYYIYNFTVIILFRRLLKDECFIKKLLKVLKLNLFTQIIIYLIGIGRYYESTRYMGTFNDPNQMAFYIYILFMLIVIVSDILKYKVKALYYLIAIFLIFETSSTGMLLGIGSFTLIYATVNYVQIKKEIKLNIKTLLSLIGILIILVVISIPNMNSIVKSIQDMPILNRVDEKISEISGNNTSSNNEKTIVKDRGLDKLLIYPEQILFGSGQGYYARFNKAYHMGEIHSTLPSILFYYGIIPTILIILWFIKNIKNIPLQVSAIYISLLIESFTLLNQRQPFFWMLFVLGHVYSNKREYVN